MHVDRSLELSNPKKNGKTHSSNIIGPIGISNMTFALDPLEVQPPWLEVLKPPRTFFINCTNNQKEKKFQLEIYQKWTFHLKYFLMELYQGPHCIFVEKTFRTSHAHDVFLLVWIGIFSILTNTTKRIQGVTTSISNSLRSLQNHSSSPSIVLLKQFNKLSQIFWVPITKKDA